MQRRRPRASRTLVRLAIAGETEGCERAAACNCPRHRESCFLTADPLLRPIRAIAGVESLYDNQSTSTFALTSLLYQKSTSSATGATCTLTEGVEFVGHDLHDGPKRVHDHTACCSLCSSVTGCAGFTFIEGACHLKTEATNARPRRHRGIVSGLLIHAPGPDSRKHVSLAPAIARTVANSVVTANTTGLSVATAAGISVANDTGTAGPIDRPKESTLKMVGNCTLVEALDLVGFDVPDGARTLPSAEKCCEVCSRVDGCSAYTFVVDTCWLKTALALQNIEQSAARNAKAVSGFIDVDVAMLEGYVTRLKQKVVLDKKREAVDVAIPLQKREWLTSNCWEQGAGSLLNSAPAANNSSQKPHLTIGMVVGLPTFNVATFLHTLRRKTHGVAHHVVFFTDQSELLENKHRFPCVEWVPTKLQESDRVAEGYHPSNKRYVSTAQANCAAPHRNTFSAANP